MFGEIQVLLRTAVLNYYRSITVHGGKWVLGLIERVSGRCWMEVVARRDAPTLERIILMHVLPGSIIMTDAWAGYANVGQLNNGIFQHEVVLHAYMFVHDVHPEIHNSSGGLT